MTYAEIKAAWDTARSQALGLDSFYERFETLTGIPRDAVAEHFTAWNLLSHSEAEAVAERHGTTLRDGGFQAYLADVTGPAVPG